ncbi:hypothetical protein COU77_02755 [Candidatus Peregrinibacteria bacterium CG10_big_fil_rev_8_21_14_0_10_49_16]|nr:MAG: hypothetical protein COW95_02265 [Candidatus Peregrinibacteria bacterium CG22_combo_CG10-13_8_21_14_all_49_11]PIR51958.1 MAG: hypothetical protein COU77_02755 [Candidatus Peregrinibacteria bacterium CG10_big_fil_rev_8_21_14_0_10_49_16]
MENPYYFQQEEIRRRDAENVLMYAPKHHSPNLIPWPRCPEAEQYVQEQIEHFLENHTFARELQKRMREETSTRFTDWVDHVSIPLRPQHLTRLSQTGFTCRYEHSKQGHGIPYWHPHGDFPDILLHSDPQTLEVAMKVDSIKDFLISHNRLDLIDQVEGSRFGKFRRIRIPEGSIILSIVERRGYKGFTPDTDLEAEEKYLHAKATWDSRIRDFEPKRETEGMEYTLQLAQKIAEDVGPDLAADIAMASEREYWTKRNAAARLQKVRQDRLGLGWANHDHHTFRSSRKHYLTLMKIFQTLGFKKRERYSPPDADWGAQIFEQPNAGIVIFADVDLFPEEKEDDFDFSTQKLPTKRKCFTVGRWCALHGDSILQAGMHHLEAQFDFDKLETDLKAQDVHMIDPFSNECDADNRLFLKQTFTEGEMWPVDQERLDTALSRRAIGKKTYNAIMQTRKAVGSVLENLERNMGYKGFKQEGVSDVLDRVDPKKLAEESEETRRKLTKTMSS